MEENKYKAALERAKSAIKECGDNIGRIRMIESIFPELVESEDEKIRKQIIAFLRSPFINENIADWKVAPWIAYLEKVKDFDKQLEDAYKNSDEVQYKRGYDAAMREITYTEREADAKTIRELQERIKELSHSQVTKKSEQDGWTEEDERLLNGIYYTFEGIAPLSYEKEIDWLKSIKERVHPKQEWNAEDEDVCRLIKNKFVKSVIVSSEELDRVLDWFESLKQRLQ